MKNILPKVIRWMPGVLLTLMLIMAGRVNGQELKADVEVNSTAIEGSSKSVFETLQQSLSEYINSRAWTNTQFSPNERIECRFYFTAKEYKDDRIKGDLQIQLSRPVYNSTYTTTLFNFKDTKIEFDYREGDPLIYNENTFDNNLTGIINFYVYLLLGIDFDSFSYLGGQPYYDKAASIVQMAQSSGEIGWKTFEDTKNRSAVLSAYTDPNTSGIRKLMYDYHRKGLDEMVTSPDKGRSVITESLIELEKIQKNSPMSVILSIFRDSKLDELVNLYSKAPQTERDKAYDLLSPVYPTDNERLTKIHRGDDE
ncbi:MAG: DUF4835 family protein [Prevotella sp.]|nr:DUF4835 family protein [Bacteroides sp.]MCM1365682.1 DUF4835 family protein [Prevotella sp.]MCM1437136.1 DUF4835 family protein [Prevotella sp.]